MKPLKKIRWDTPLPSEIYKTIFDTSRFKKKIDLLTIRSCDHKIDKKKIYPPEPDQKHREIYNILKEISFWSSQNSAIRFSPTKN